MGIIFQAFICLFYQFSYFDLCFTIGLFFTHVGDSMKLSVTAIHTILLYYRVQVCFFCKAMPIRLKIVGKWIKCKQSASVCHTLETVYFISAFKISRYFPSSKCCINEISCQALSKKIKLNSLVFRHSLLLSYFLSIYFLV